MFFFSPGSVDFFFFAAFRKLFCFALLRQGLLRFSFLSPCVRRATQSPDWDVQKEKKSLCFFFNSKNNLCIQPNSDS
ncbi:MAG: hypothetical protein O7D30_10475, partial [Rickettsia endosymbiont of Ixodes persulcatus]|nr:hypothetical protein [Rickettsia endosymbiont of Ixodes persulcatus]